ncbi:Sulfotransferase family protein [Puniceibacterium sediminis]|uniref:Sulfotransferase family protein n=2 Tax=Puniceibacterium sediminis TaxID=1608407 RepID=A0A238YLT7_9RHOB|nr:Sulfotransferase family protein [Puniceibacterium sediminis]
MLRSILNRAPEIQLAGETHYFDDLRPRFDGRALSGMSAEEQAVCADYFRSQSIRPYGVRANPEESPLSRDDLLGPAAAVDGPTRDSVDAVFETYCRWHMSQAGARIWGEKTPRHIFRIDDILAAYPEARILCTVRDPRAVVASYRDWEYQGGLRKAEGNADYQAAIAEDQKRKETSYHIVIASMMWRAAARAAFAAQAKHSTDRVRVVRYEDVVGAPADTVRPIAEWLGVGYDDSLLEIPLHNSSTTRFDEKAGPSAAPNRRWHKVLSPQEIAIIQRVAGKALDDAGYAREPVKAGPLDLLAAYASLPGVVVRAARANRSRYTSLPAYVMRRLKAALG